jgi:hypothetical protein
LGEKKRREPKEKPAAAAPAAEKAVPEPKPVDPELEKK